MCHNKNEPKDKHFAILTITTTAIITYSFTFFQNIDRAKLRLVLRNVTDYKKIKKLVFFSS